MHNKFTGWGPAKTGSKARTHPPYGQRKKCVSVSVKGRIRGAPAAARCVKGTAEPFLYGIYPSFSRCHARVRAVTQACAVRAIFQRRMRFILPRCVQRERSGAPIGTTSFYMRAAVWLARGVVNLLKIQFCIGRAPGVFCYTL